MGTDPVPTEVAIHFRCNRPVMKPDPRAPEAPDFLEVQRWVLWILLQQSEVLVGELANIGGSFS